MTRFGHAAVGVSIGYLAISRTEKTWKKILFLAFFGWVANFPDLEIKGYGGHYQYLISHSIIVNTIIILCLYAAYFLFCKWKKVEINYRFSILLAVAWLSHFLLDSFYNHGSGIRIYWPLSNGALALPIPWLRTRDPSLAFFSWHNTKIYLKEIGTFLPFLLLCIGLHYYLPMKKETEFIERKDDEKQNEETVGD